MATITELANAIDGYVDNRATTRDILIDQIKKATRQIRRKENNLHQNLVCRIANVIDNLHQYQTNAQNQNNPPNQVNMAGIPHLYFDWNDSIPDFLVQLRLNLQNWGIDPNDNIADPPIRRDNAIGHLRARWKALVLDFIGEKKSSPIESLDPEIFTFKVEALRKALDLVYMSEKRAYRLDH
ncbi:hypothetical protein RhiirA1_446632 [Rhizophagus irregularis]|uniref:Uncharacterized protein n=1 Tax=Rhizophagus irregularis TaxID=588596 RepID=A0A2N0QYQ7_9GLOM|nr:hypothetical protein RhiirA1_446632 [Rhizophagus irregularis]